MILKKQITEVPNACNYCRKLMKTENPPETLELYRGEMLCLTVDVKGASELRLVENNKVGPIHQKYYDSQKNSLVKLLKGSPNV